MCLSWLRKMETSDQMKKHNGAWGFHHRGLISEMGLLYKVKYYMLLYKALQISHLSPVLIVPKQEKLMYIVKRANWGTENSFYQRYHLW